MSSHIRKFTSFREVKHKFDKYNESVVQIDDKYRVGGIEVSQSLINSYIKKIKDETGKNVRQMFSDMEIAEQLVRYVAANKLDVDKIPTAALLGGEIPMDDDEIIDDTTEVTADETGLTEEPAQPPVGENPNPEGGSEPIAEEPIAEAPEPVDNEELPTDFEEPNLDENPTEETPNPEGTEEPIAEAPVDGEDEEEKDEEESDIDKEENQEGNEDLPI